MRTQSHRGEYISKPMTIEPVTEQQRYIQNIYKWNETIFRNHKIWNVLNNNSFIYHFVHLNVCLWLHTIINPHIWKKTLSETRYLFEDYAEQFILSLTPYLFTVFFNMRQNIRGWQKIHNNNHQQQPSNNHTRKSNDKIEYRRILWLEPIWRTKKTLFHQFSTFIIYSIDLLFTRVKKRFCYLFLIVKTKTQET